MSSISTLNLDGNSWLLSTDPENVGTGERWYEEVTGEAKAARVPGIIQESFLPTTASLGIGASLLRQKTPMTMDDTC